MNTKKRGAGAATQNRAESSDNLNEIKPGFVELQDCIRSYFNEQDRHEARMAKFRAVWPPSEPYPERMETAARNLIRALDMESKRHFIFCANILGRFRRNVAYDSCAQLVFQRGLFARFFMDEKDRWFMRRESGEWVQTRINLVKAEMKLFGVGTRKTENGVSDFECASIWFCINRIELTPAVRKSILTGERLSVEDIFFRCSPGYVSMTRGMETMYREFGAGKGWRF